MSNIAHVPNMLTAWLYADSMKIVKCLLYSSGKKDIIIDVAKEKERQQLQVSTRVK